MARWSWSRAALVIVVAVAVSGCVDFSGEGPVPFASLEAPAWSPGNNWTWSAVSEATYSESGPDGMNEHSGRSRTTLVHEVLGTAPLSDGRMAPVLSRQGELEDFFYASLFSSDALVAADPATLLPLAYAYVDPGCISPDSVRWSNFRAYTEEPPLLQFPLTHGAAWDGGQDELVWTARVVGEEEVQVPAGSFRAVLVTIEARAVFEDAPEVMPMMDEESGEPALQEASMTVKVWYSAAARNIVRMETMRAVEFSSGDESYSEAYSATMVLQSLGLASSEGATFAKVHLGGFSTPRPPEVHVVADREFPLNAALGTNVTFALEAGPRASEIDFVEEVVPFDFGPDWAGHEVLWRFYSSEGGWYASASGMTPTVELPPGGHVRISISLVSEGAYDGRFMGPMPMPPMVVEELSYVGATPMPYSSPGGPCRGGSSISMYGLGSVSGEVYWEESFTIEVPAGLPQTFGLGSFRAPEAPGLAWIEFVVASDVPVVTDETYVVLTAPEGAAAAFPSGSEALVQQGGEWSVDWRAVGLTGGNLPELLVAGHEATVRLEVRY